MSDIKDLEQAFAVPDLPVQTIEDPLFAKAGVRLSILRTDLVHPLISGNKWFKLKHNLLRAAREGHDTILSFGGPWSNHLHALAHAGQAFGFRTIGIVRGDIPEQLNPCLADARKAGMTLQGMSRDAYRHKQEPAILDQLHRHHGDFYMVPEGGANREGAMGCREMLAAIDLTHFDLVAMACGTGTMLAGLASISPIPLLGIQVLKGEGYLTRVVADLLNDFRFRATCDWSILDQFHAGGYAKTSPELLSFITGFERRHNIPLDHVYTGKLLYGLQNLILRDFFPQNWSILVIHSGGLQGRRGIL